MTPAEKRATWRRITMEGTAWRFNRYAERAKENVPEHERANANAMPPPAADAG